MVAQHGIDASRAARAKFESGTNAYYRLCLRAVREYLGIDPKFYSAKEAWANAAHKHQFSNPDDIPLGVPVWTEARGGSEFGHIILSGPRVKKLGGDRVFWTTDQHGDGRITPVPLSFFPDVWGHQILGRLTPFKSSAHPRIW